MAKLGQFDQGSEWQIQNFSNNHETSTLRDCALNFDDLQVTFPDLDQWLDENYFTEGSADLSTEHAPLLAPSLYAAFSEPEKTSNERFTQQEDHQTLPDTSIAELSSLVQKMQLELEDKTRKLDLLGQYIEGLQPWIEDMNSTVQSLMSQDHQHRTISGDDCNSHETTVDQGLA